MRIKESAIRQIIKEELNLDAIRRILREDDTDAPAVIKTSDVQAGSVSAGEPAKVTIKRPPGYVDPNAAPLTIDQAFAAAYKRTLDPNSLFRVKLMNVWNSFLPQIGEGSRSSVIFEFQLNPDGKADPKTIKVTCTPDHTAKYGVGLPTTKFSAEIKKLIAAESWPRPPEPYIYDQAEVKPLVFSS